MIDSIRGALAASVPLAAFLSASLPAHAQGGALAAQVRTVPAPTVVVHPLDALVPGEIDRTVALLRQARHVDDGTRFGTITLREPPKGDVLAWRAGRPIPRASEVVALHRGVTHVGVVDLTAGKVVSWTPMRDRQMSFLYEEIIGSTEIVKADAGWRAAMAKRGITTYDDVLCNPLAVGHVADPKLRAHRLMKVPCFDVSGNRDNIYARPVEGLLALVDLSARKVIELVDLGVVRVPTAAPRFDRASQGSDRTPLKPVEMTAPLGSNVVRDGSLVRWDRWSFHLRLDRRVGPVLSLVRWRDGDRERSIAYALSASEMFVPYMDADPTWSFKSYLDAGEYGLGLLASPLTPGVDCPTNAAYLDATLQDDLGKPLPMSRAICVFERNAGDPVWRHFEFNTGGTFHGVPGVDLVVRSIATIGNYDYLLDYVFTTAGEIEVRVGATGIDAVKGVASQDMRSATIAEDTRAGTLIAPGLVGISHDHYVGFRLDLDVDGAGNTFEVQDLVPQRLPEGNPRRSLWAAEPRTLATEGPVTADPHSAFFTVVNPTAPGPLGRRPSYVLLPGHSATSLLSPDDPIQGRAAFSGEALWVSAYRPEEHYAAGTFANQSAPGEGVPAYVSDRQSIVNADLVLWYTVGFRHLTRTEDWPVMPTLWHSFRLRPANFFARNPAMDASMTPVAPVTSPTAAAK
jgi:primary-amine oxidase